MNRAAASCFRRANVGFRPYFPMDEGAAGAYAGAMTRRAAKTRRLSLKTLMAAAGALLTAAAIALASTIYADAERVRRNAERAALARTVLETYLGLSSDTYQFFKQMADVALSGAAGGDGEDALLVAAKADIERIRSLIADEVRLFSDYDDEAAELVALADIERTFDGIVRRHRAILATAGLGGGERAAAEYAALFEGSIDRDFSRMISEAIAEERREVEAADARLRAALARIRLSALATAGVAIPLALLFLAYVNWLLIRGVDRLTRAADAYAGGDLDYKIGDAGAGEFAAIGARLASMAAELGAGRREVGAARARLEAKVAERTAALKEANERLSEANLKLEESDAARRRFFADISHELRTPLTVIRGEAEIALRGRDKSAEEYKAGLARIVGQTAQTTRLVEDLLFMARADAGEPRLELRSVAVGPLVEESVRGFSAPAAEKSLRIAVRLEHPEAVVLGDRFRLMQVLSILVDNAVRYSRPLGEIRVSARAEGDDIEIAIEDDGIGIEPGELGRVFDRFYRGGAAQAHADGAGLGLPVAKAIVEAHHGRLALGASASGGVRAAIRLGLEARLRAIS